MSEKLISANRLKKAFSADTFILQDWDADLYELLMVEIDEAPAVDAVEVVRCRDCKHWGQDVCGTSGDDESFCTNPDGLDNFAHPDDFCSYGERREE